MTDYDDAPARGFAGLVPTYADEPLAPTVYLFNDQTIMLPRGHVVVMFGPGGVGKGMVAVDLAARNSRGENAAGEPGLAIMVTPEDDINETVAWRLRAAGADPQRVVNLTTLPGGGTQFTLGVYGRTAADRRAAALRNAMAMSELEAQIEKLQAYDEQLRLAGETDPARFANPNLVILEPLLGIVGGNLLATDDGARSVLAPLQQLAARTGVCVLITHHTTKEGKNIAGSRAMINAPRLVYELARAQAERVVKLSLYKSNITGMSGSSLYLVTDEGADSRVLWADAQGNPIGAAPTVDGLPAWRARALQGPLSAIAGAHPEPVTAFSEMTGEEQLDHLAEMHTMQGSHREALAAERPVYLRDMLENLHGLRHDAMSAVPHRHARAMARAGLPEGRRAA